MAERGSEAESEVDADQPTGMIGGGEPPPLCKDVKEIKS